MDNSLFAIISQCWRWLKPRHNVQVQLLQNHHTGAVLGSLLLGRADAAEAGWKGVVGGTCGGEQTGLGDVERGGVAR